MSIKSFSNKLMTSAVACALLLSLQGCGEKIDGRQVNLNQGLIYKINSDNPFTGKITNYSPSALGFMVHGSCEVQVKDGILEGPAKCATEQGNKLVELAYKNGKQDGEVNVWNEAGKLRVKFNVVSGVKDGLEEYYNSETGKTIRQTSWSQGSKEGSEKVWDRTGETILTNLMWKDGKQTGYAKTGERENNYKNGDYDGVQRNYSLIDGDYDSQKKYMTEFAAAQQNNADYFIGLLGSGKYKVREEIYSNGQKTQQPPQIETASTPIDACLDAKIAGFHKEKGEDAVISNDMIEEWRNGCKPN
jgi:antitoxin component YwqK of YwqJK toxin-antitoxin module